MIDSINILNIENRGDGEQLFGRPLHLTEFLLGSLPAYRTF
jgi:hypothetical protein